MLYTIVMTNAKKQKIFRENNFYTIQESGIGFLVALLAPYAISLVVLLVVTLIGADSETLANSLAYNIVTCLVSPLAFCIAFFAFNKVKKISCKAAKVDFKIGTWNMIICFVVSLVCFFGCMYFIGGIDHLLELGGYKLSGITLPVDNAGWLVLSIILLAALPAIFEELIFRGVLLNSLRDGLGDIPALFMSAFLFAIMHGSIQQLVYPLILGIVLGWIAMRTGSTFSSMLVHFLNNTITLVINYFTIRNELDMSIDYNAWQWVLAVALVLVAAVIIYLIERFYFKHKNQEKPAEVAEDESLSENDKKSAKKAAKAPQKSIKNVPMLLWVGIGIAVILLIINTAIGFMPSSGG